MKKSVSYYVRVIQSVLLMAIVQAAVSQGIPSNTGQSSQHVRMLSRNASNMIDAVYYNPAGLSELANGWHFAIYDQAVFQANTINNSYPVLNDGEYKGTRISPLIPSAFGVYKAGNVVFSLGMGLSAGDCITTYERGLPSFEIPLSRMIPDLTALSNLRLTSMLYDLSGYAADIHFEERTLYPGIQAGITYKFNEVLSGFAGIRYTFGSGTYKGHVNDAQLIVDDDMVDAYEWLSETLLPDAIGARNTYNGAATATQQLISAGAGNFTLAQVQAAGYISSAQRATFEGALYALGLSSVQVAALKLNQIYSYYSTEATNLNSVVAVATTAINAASFKEMNARQTGAGWTPILGMSLNVNEKVNVGVKYEFMTRLMVTNSSSADDFEVYPDGNEVEISIPALLAIGIGYKPMDLLEAQISFNLIFDRSANWGLNTRDLILTGFHDIRERVVEKNTWELALGLQYSIRNDLSLSAGCMTTRPGVDDSYQSAFGFVSPSFTVGAGFAWKITDMLTLDAGVRSTFYQDVNLTYFDVKLQEWNDKYPAIYSGNNYVSGEYTEKLSKRHLVVSAGITYSILKTEK
jgi:long-subunit fatty acid transport protein